MRNALHEIGHTLARVAAYCIALGMLAFGVKELVAALPPDPSGNAAEPRLQWVQVADPVPALALELTDFLGARPYYALWRHPGGGRRDRLTWAPQEGRSFAVEVYRPGAEADEADMAAAEEAGASVQPAEAERGGVRAAIASKFGPFALKPAPPADNGARCLGFARNFDEPSLQIAGLYCARSIDLPVARLLIACSLDRLTLVSAGGDARLAGLFAHAELKRSSCGPGRLPVAAMPRRGDWIDAAASRPRLRGATPGD